jgi:hypothetical protein
MRERTGPRFGALCITVVACGSVLVPRLGFAADTKANVTFTKDVAPILQQKCQVCHHPGTNAPMSLVTYEETRPWDSSSTPRVTCRSTRSMT